MAYPRCTNEGDGVLFAGLAGVDCTGFFSDSAGLACAYGVAGFDRWVLCLYRKDIVK